MLFIKKHPLLTFFLFGVIAALILFKPGCNKPAAPPPVTPAKEIKEVAKKMEWDYKKTADSLQARIVKVQDTVRKQKTELQRYKYQAEVMEGIINDLQLAPADSQKVHDYIAVVQIGDSLCDATIQAQERVISGKDSVIRLTNTYLSEKDKLLFNALDNYATLEKYSNSNLRKLRWTRISNKIWKGAAIAGAAYFLVSIIK